MTYIVLECHPSYAVLLDEEGRFWKAANLQYTVGQTVTDPFLMRETREKPTPTMRRLGAVVMAAAACLLVFFGSRYYYTNVQSYTSIYLSINPEVQIELNRQGEVVRLHGENADGEALLEGYDGRGKDKVTVADELIDRAIDMGFLSDGGEVSFFIDAPDEAIFRDYGVELRTAITEHLDGRITIVIEITNTRTSETPSDSTPDQTTAASAQSTTNAPQSSGTQNQTAVQSQDEPGQNTSPPQTAASAPETQTPATQPPQTAAQTGGRTDYGDDDWDDNDDDDDANDENDDWDDDNDDWNDDDDDREEDDD